MKLRKNTWHYKLYRYLRNFLEEEGPVLPFRGHRTDYQPKSLCSYFWTTVLMAVTFPLLLSILTAGAIVVGVTAPIWWTTLTLYRSRKERKERIWAALEEAYVSGVGPHPSEILKKQPRQGDILIVAWFKAYKSKHCPLIQLVD